MMIVTPSAAVVLFPSKSRARVYSTELIPNSPLRVWGSPVRRELPRGREARVHDPGCFEQLALPVVFLGLSEDTWSLTGYQP